MLPIRSASSSYCNQTFRRVSCLALRLRRPNPTRLAPSAKHTNGALIFHIYTNIVTKLNPKNAEAGIADTSLVHQRCTTAWKQPIHGMSLGQLVSDHLPTPDTAPLTGIVGGVGIGTVGTAGVTGGMGTLGWPGIPGCKACFIYL